MPRFLLLLKKSTYFNVVIYVILDWQSGREIDSISNTCGKIEVVEA